MSGVAVDQGTPGAPPVNADGSPVGSNKIHISFEADKEGARTIARAVAKMGHQQMADHISATIGEGKVTLSLTERYPISTGILVGILSSATVYGAYRTWRWVRNRNALKNAMANGKVVPIAPAKLKVA